MRATSRFHFLAMVLLLVGALLYSALPVPSRAQTDRSSAAIAIAAAQPRQGRVIPTTSNPTSNGTTASRTYANTSFEQSDYQCFSGFNGTHWAAIGQDKMRGWFTAHSLATETNCPGYVRSGQRVLELQTAYNGANYPYHGSVFAELNAFEASFVYQKLCMKSGEAFDFKFHHKTLSASRADIIQMRFGIPSGLPAGAVTADTYSRPVMYGKTTGGADKLATSAVYTGFTFSSTTYTTPAGTTSPTGTLTGVNGWAEYSGTHTMPATGWDGVFNLGFQAIDGDSPNGGNLLDGIEVGLSPLVDLGSSRDTSAGEQTVPTSLKIRINGRVPAATSITLTATGGDATPDTDYSLGTASAGAYGNATTTHTSGSTVWTFAVPAGDYDGGVVPANNKGGLTIPITYSYDQVSEGTEYVQFAISDPGADGSSATWAKGDPVCDSSQKNDGVVYTITNVDPTNTPTPTATNTFTPTMTYTPSMTYTPTKTPSPTIPSRGGAIPTSSAPTIDTSIAGVRTMANTSFEVTDTACSILTGGWDYIRQEHMAGWFTAHPPHQEACNSTKSGPSSYRVIELNQRGDAPDGNNVASLNAEVASFLYQKLCLRNGDTFDFEFYHNVGGTSRTDIAAFRLGIPSGLPADSVPADSYDREILRASSTVGGTANIVTGVSQTSGSGTTGGAASIVSGWGKYSGTHTLPASGYNGVRNIGFYGIQSVSPGAGNLLDKITLGLTPFMDMGASRDATILESNAGSVKIRINGRVASGTTVVLRMREGTATSDSDFTIGTVSAGIYGTATVTHTSGSDIWTITVPAGDYDGGIFPSNNAGGLTIPVNYLYDVPQDTGEYAMFQLGAPGDDGASTNWELTDPTCDGSFKDDGVVHTITNLAPTATPTSTPTNTYTPTNTPTRTYTPTNTNTPTPTNTPSGQYISFATPSDKVDGDAPFTLAATSSIGQPIIYASTSPAVCTVSGSTVTIVGPGTCSITADSPGATVGGVTYTAAPQITRSFVVKTRQTLTMGALSNKIYNAPDFSVSATASSGLTASYSSLTPSICTVTSSGVVDMLTVGTCTVAADQSGGTVGGVVYAPAPRITRSFEALGIPQTITVPAATAKHDYDPAFTVGATASSGLPARYTTSTTTVCTVDATTGLVRVYTAGTCIITVSQPGGSIGGSIYAAAPAATYRFEVDDNTPTPSRTRTNTSTVTLTPTKTPTNTPTPIPNLLKKAAVGSSFVLGLLQNGSLVTWGMNKEYQTNIPPCCASGVTDVAVGTNFALALRGGRVFGWGANTRGQITIPKTALKGISSIAAGYAHGLALTTKGSVVCWGNNLTKQCDIPTKLTGIKAVAGGTDHTLVILKDDTVKGFGKNDVGQVTTPANLGKVRAISAGCDHSLAVRVNGTAVGWGSNRYLQARVPDNLIDVKSISAGCHFSMAMMNDGTVFGWGRNDTNQVSIPKGITNAFAVGAGYANSIISLRDGSVIALGAPDNGALVTRTPTPTP